MEKSVPIREIRVCFSFASVRMSSSHFCILIDPSVFFSCNIFTVRYNERMKTLTITEGRGRLGYWLKKAAQGEDVGFMFEGKIVALRPVEIISADYALQEYGLTSHEMAVAEKRLGAELKTARKRRELTPFTGRVGVEVTRL